MGSDPVDCGAKIGCTAQTLHAWVRQHERDTGQRDGVSNAETARIKELERESRAGKHAQDFLGDWRGTLVCDDYSGYKAMIAKA